MKKYLLVKSCEGCLNWPTEGWLQGLLALVWRRLWQVRKSRGAESPRIGQVAEFEVILEMIPNVFEPCWIQVLTKKVGLEENPSDLQAGFEGGSYCWV